MLADSRAKSAYLPALGALSRMDAGVGMWRESATPLLRDGDRRDSNDHVYGPLAGGGEAALCHYTYEVRRETTDSKGHTTTHWDDHPFTVIETGVIAPGITRLTLHPRSFGDNRLFDRDRLQADLGPGGGARVLRVGEGVQARGGGFGLGHGSPVAVRAGVHRLVSRPGRRNAVRDRAADTRGRDPRPQLRRGRAGSARGRGGHDRHTVGGRRVRQPRRRPE